MVKTIGRTHFDRKLLSRTFQSSIQHVRVFVLNLKLLEMQTLTWIGFNNYWITAQWLSPVNKPSGVCGGGFVFGDLIQADVVTSS